MAKELEQFLGRGNERAFWIFTYKNAGGAVLGGFFGSRLGQAMGGGAPTFILGLLGVILGLVFTLDRRGLMWARRWGIVARFYLMRAISKADQNVIDATELYEVTEIREQPIVIRKAGKTIMTPTGIEKERT